jgi:O-antigen biosynthesis protein
MGKDQRKLHVNIQRFWHPINIYNNLKALYFAIIPKGSKGYDITYGFLRIFLKQLHLINIYYQEWLRQFDSLTDEDFDEVKARISAMESPPNFSIIMPVYNPDIPFFEQAIQSVLKQVYAFWELCIADDASTDPEVREVIEQYAAEDSRIKFKIRDKNGHISAASNSALELASNEYVVLLDHDDLLHPLALFYVAEEIKAHPNSIIIFSDEDKITKRGRRLDPYFKPEFDYELQLSQNMVSHLGVYRRTAVMEVSGFRIGLEGSQDYDLLLRVLETCQPDQIVHIPRPLYHWRISKESVSLDVNIKPYAVEAGKRALNEHLQRRSVDAEITYLPELAGYSVTYALPPTQPTVTIIILAQTLTHKLSKMIDMIISNTAYDHYNLHLWLTSTNEDHVSKLQNNWKEIVRIFNEVDRKGSYAEAINHCIRETSTEFVCLLDSSIDQFPSNWLSDLVGQGIQANIGAVAPKLINTKNDVFSSGIILTPDITTAHLSFGEDRGKNGYFGWAKLCRGYSALSEKCLLFRRDHWQSVGGMNEIFHSPLYCGVDFCLKLKEQGLRNVLRPSIELYLQPHNKSEQDIDSLGQHLEEDKAYLQERWGTIIQNDPAFNPNLSIVDEGKILVNLSPNLNFPGV